MLFAVCSFAATRLKWDAPTTGGVVTKYFVYSDEQAEPIAETDAAVTEVSLSSLNLTPGKPYNFTVKAYNAAGLSAPSNSAAYTPPVVEAPAVKPLVQTITITGPVTIQIN